MSWPFNWSIYCVWSRVGTDQDCGQRAVLPQVFHSAGRSSNQSHHQRPGRAGRSPPTDFHPCWNCKRQASQKFRLWKRKRRLKVVFLLNNTMNPLINSICTHHSLSHRIHQHSRPCCRTPGGIQRSDHCDTQSQCLKDNWRSPQHLKHKHRIRSEGETIMRYFILFRTETGNKNQIFCLRNATMGILLKHILPALCTRKHEQQRRQSTKALREMKAALLQLCHVWDRAERNDRKQRRHIYSNSARFVNMCGALKQSNKLGICLNVHLKQTSVFMSLYERVFVCCRGKGDIPHSLQTSSGSRLMWNICLGHEQQTVSVTTGHHRENHTGCL